MVEEQDRVFLTSKELAKRWKKKPQTVRRAQMSKLGVPWVKLGGAVRFALSDIIEYENNNKFITTQGPYHERKYRV